jgi:hypothetical protein
VWQPEGVSKMMNAIPEDHAGTLIGILFNYKLAILFKH